MGHRRQDRQALSLRQGGSLTSGSHKATESHQLAVGNASPQGIAILPEKAPLDLPRTAQPAGQE